jgi:glutathionylspermidine synthase
LTDEVVKVTAQETEKYYEAAQNLYEMLCVAAQYVIDNQRYEDLQIPAAMQSIIEHTWNDERNIHLYGRFDFSGGIGLSPIKLIEFNANTATCLPEAAVVQWLHLKANGLEESLQFNSLYETIKEHFEHLKNINKDLAPKLLFSVLRNSPEDESNVALLGEAAKEAGFTVAYSYVDEVEFSATEGIFLEINGNVQHFPFWFKLVPWEFIALDEPHLLDLLTPIIVNRKAVVLQPPYVMLLQSKAILKILWDLYPNHPLLLQTADSPQDLPNKAYVEKVLFGREGANVSIFDSQGTMIEQVTGDYQRFKKIYQAYTPFMQDEEGFCYQAGVFVAGSPCGLAFRRGGKIIQGNAQFVGHIISNYL